MRRFGFTLIELSIVLVIVGLIVGGVLVGQDLIQAAAYRKTIGQKEQFITAANTFKTKYNCYPGDCAQAYNFFGTACGTNATDEINGCNGNGDGYVTLFDLDTGAMVGTGENVKYWYHLWFSKLLANNYTGRDYDPGTHAAGNEPRLKVGVNTPAAAISGLGWASIQCADAVGEDASSMPETRKAFCLGSDLYTNWTLDQGGMSFEMAFILDNKFDDGKPRTGSIHGDMSGDCGGENYSDAAAPGTSAWTRINSDCSLTFLY